MMAHMHTDRTPTPAKVRLSADLLRLPDVRRNLAAATKAAA